MGTSKGIGCAGEDTRTTADLYPSEHKSLAGGPGLETGATSAYFATPADFIMLYSTQFLERSTA